MFSSSAASLSLILIASASLLGLIITLLLLYMVIRLGVSHALRSHAQRYPNSRI